MLSDGFQGTERFRIISKLGAGGMGIVYEALDRERQVRVALKTLRLWNPDALLAFKREFRALQDIRHPNLVRFGELIEADGAWFFTMELVEGVDFLSYVRASNLEAGPPEADEAPTLDPAGLTPDGVPSTTRSERPPPVALEKAAMIRGGADAEPEPETIDLVRFDEGRLRSALAQLVEGLIALHDSGKIHRDIKPWNILVDNRGRLVVLDFGLVTEALSDRSKSEVDLVGTTMYMAPEQAASEKPVGPPADWYSVGTMLYQALTGRLPFEGTPIQVLMAKQESVPPPPKSLARGIPDDLDRICTSLLALDPAARPTGREILLGLQKEKPAEPMVPPSSGAPFVGREKELERLWEAFNDVGKGRAVTVFVSGESGVGKSALVRRFVNEVVVKNSAVALTGRCYENESVPYKALDGVVDSLTHFIRRLAKVDAVQLMPLRANLLVQAFPVLGRITAIARPPARRTEPMDPQELRTRVFEAMRELLARVGQRYPLVIVIDDLQWTDADSLALLGEILRPPDAPALLLVATMRKAGLQAPFTATLGQDVRRIELENLPEVDACELVRQLLADVQVTSPIHPEIIATEAAGHPFFIDELVRHVRLHGSRGEGPLRLEDALVRRIRDLDPKVRRVLALVTLAGTRIPQEVIAHAFATWEGLAQAELSGPRGPTTGSGRTGRGATRFAEHVDVLRSGKLVRTTGAFLGDAIEPYHDRVREAMLGEIEEASRKEAHAHIALALEGAAYSDAEAIANHWLGAGDREKALRFAELAARRATETLAFDRSARLYRMALDLGPLDETEEHRLKVLCARALADAGRLREAGDLFLDSAKKASLAEALELKRLAADQFLRTGLVDEAVSVLSSVLENVGLSFPRSPADAVARILFDRLRLAVRGHRFKRRDADQIPPADLARVDLAWSVGFAYPSMDPIRGAPFQTKQLLLALRAGEPFRVARGLALEATLTAMAGPKTRARTDRLLQNATNLGAEIGSEDALGLIAWSSGFCAILQGRFREGLVQCERSVEVLGDRPGVSWEIGNAHLGAVLCMVFLGEIEALLKRLPFLIKNAEDRGNRYLSSALRTGQPIIAWLAHDDVEGARWNATESMRDWSRAGFHIQHANDLTARTSIDLYLGQGRAAHQHFLDLEKEIARSFITRLYLIRVILTEERARCALAAAADPATPDSEKSALFARAKRDAGALKKEGTAFALASSELVRATLHAGKKEMEAAAHCLEAAARGFDACEDQLRAAVVRLRLGALIGGDAGLALVRAAETWMIGQKIARPDRMAGMLAPGF